MEVGRWMLEVYIWLITKVLCKQITALRSSAKYALIKCCQLFLMTKVDWTTNLQPDLSGNPFLLVFKFYLSESFCKKDWERKADKAAQII